MTIASPRMICCLNISNSRTWSSTRDGKFIASSYIDYRVGIQALRVISRAKVSKLLDWCIVTMDDHADQ